MFPHRGTEGDDHSQNSKGHHTLSPLNTWSDKSRTSIFCIRVVIVLVNSRFLQRPQTRSRGNQLIHRRLSKPKSIGSGSDPESQADRQSDSYGGWSLE